MFCSKNFRIKTGLFALVLINIVFAINSYAQETKVTPCDSKIGISNNGRSTGEGNGLAVDFGYNPKDFIEAKPKTYSLRAKHLETKTVRIISKPRPLYTEEAMENGVEGVIKLRITFYANGKLGNFTIVNGLKCGLNEQAITAAKKIKFKPAIVNGQPITITKQIEYSFKIH